MVTIPERGAFNMRYKEMKVLSSLEDHPIFFVERFTWFFLFLPYGGKENVGATPAWREAISPLLFPCHRRSSGNQVKKRWQGSCHMGPFRGLKID